MSRTIFSKKLIEIGEDDSENELEFVEFSIRYVRIIEKN
jgi:hypothetical protein